ncbi:YxeA family protein [Listeria rustica]|uniref:YxeA family protein n=1 Tax=Listeria rustica TaxID=2713503 RepID=A0A7W1YFR3_9LIST|nr:YxeA family protein [Listeria rustica]MBA3925980.1 YxeA family protein [Listeria rustica]
MKKLMIALIVIVIIIGGGLLAMRFINFNRIGADTYYVKIETDGKKTSGQASDGSTYTDYNYDFTGYNEDGKEKQVELTAQKNLRKGAYLEVFVKDDKGVTSYQEVKQADIPKKAAEKLN